MSPAGPAEAGAPEVGIVYQWPFNVSKYGEEKKLEVEAMHAAEKAAQYAAGSTELEERVRVLEQIVTDRGAETAAQIEALREPRPRSRAQKVSAREMS